MTTRHPPAPEATLAHWAALREKHPVSLANAWRQLRAAIAYRAPDSPPPVPMLVLFSAADGLVNPACSETLARRWNLPWRRHPSAGHDQPLDDPAWVTRQVIDWLACQKLDTAP
jgi:pimeloyl-ACP methyl ester carboxylesterase